MRAKEPDASSPELRVLLVDDDRQLLDSLTRSLGGFGVRVTPAATVEEAAQVAADPSVELDVLVLDLVLPDSWGSQFAMELTLYRPTIPVIYISGYSQEDPVFAASAAVGDIRFLEKPFAPEALAEAIRRAAREGADPGNLPSP